MNTYKKVLLTFIITFTFNVVNSQTAPNTLEKTENFLFKQNSIMENPFNKKDFQSNSSALSKTIKDDIVSKKSLIEKTNIASRKKSTLFELTKINGAGYSNTLYLMTIAIYRV